MSNEDRDNRLAAMAAQFLGLVLRHGQAGSAAAEVAAASRLHDERGLYPRLTITTPHKGGGIHLELTLHDPESDAALVRIYEVEAAAITPAWTH
jgi:hypothetical protein